jgi:DNA invertase Pin-like site-specific DNA recombinase
MIAELVPAAQYVRMSTENQQYSLDNQADAIAKYAAEHGFTVVKTYSDAAKSGLGLRNRGGLKQLLREVVEGASFRAVLVYDVSRWGRFQDTDEAAHYEYLCKSAGVPVHYCAETFANDNSVPASIMKALKRTMAGEYSRELSVKVRAGLERLTKMGYKAGGTAVYGLRRLLLEETGKPKQQLEFGQRKSLLTERVVIIPGPVEEVAVVKRIFTEFAIEHRSMKSIAKSLNREGIPYFTAGWDAGAISRLVRHPHYMGTQVWGRTRQ